MINNIKVFKLLNEGKRIAPEKINNYYFYLKDGILYMNKENKDYNVYTDPQAQLTMSNLLHNNIVWKEVKT